jgi:hypothetical protein
MYKVLCPSPVPEERDDVHGECNAPDLAERQSIINTSPIPLILKALRKFEREGKEAVLVVPDWKGQIWTPLLKKLSVQKLVLGDAEVVLEKGPDMKKKELALPLDNIAMYLLKNYVQRTRNLCCAS